MIIELQRFLLAAKEGNITRTAEKIFITQSALTQSIHRLEKELGTKLFHQQGKYLKLTDEGESIVVVGNKILQLWETAKNASLRSQENTRYSIGMFDNAALRLSSYLQKNIATQTYHLELIINNSAKLLSLLKLEIIDAAFCVLSNKNQLPKDITVLDTFTEQLLPVSSKKFRGPLHTIPFIFFNEGSYTREQTDEVFLANNIKPYIFAESTSITFMKELALLGSGVALLPKNFVRAELAARTLKIHRMPLYWERTYGLLVNEERSLTAHHPLLQSLIHELQKAK